MFSLDRAGFHGKNYLFAIYVDMEHELHIFTEIYHNRNTDFSIALIQCFQVLLLLKYIQKSQLRNSFYTVEFSYQVYSHRHTKL